MLPGKIYKPEDILAIAWKRKWLIVLPLLVGVLGSFLYGKTLPDLWRSETLILIVPQRVPENYVRSTVTMKIEDRLQSITQQITSRTRLEQVIQQSNLYQQERRTGIMEDVVDKMRKDVKIDIVRGDAFRVSYISTDPRTAMRVTERLSGMFIEENLRDREVLAEGTNQFLESQLEDARQRLQETEKKLETYRLQHAGQLPQQMDSNLQALQNYQMQVQAIVEAMNRDRDRRLLLQRQIAELQSAPPPPPAPMPTPDATGVAGASAAERLESAKAALAQLELRLKPEHPDIVRMKRVIRDFEKQAEAEALQRPVSSNPTLGAGPAESAQAKRLRELQEELATVDRQLAQKTNEEQRLRGVIGQYQGRLEATPTRESEMTALMRDYDTLQKQYTGLLGKKEESKIAANLERRQGGEQFRILDAARIPERPFSPNRQMILGLGALAGLAFGLGLIALLEYKDHSLKTDMDVLGVLSLPVLAMIPRMVTEQEKRKARRRRLQVSLATVSSMLVLTALIMWKYVQWREYLP